MSDILKRLGVIADPLPGSSFAFTEFGTLCIGPDAVPVFIAPGGEAETLTFSETVGMQVIGTYPRFFNVEIQTGDEP